MVQKSLGDESQDVVLEKKTEYWVNILLFRWGKKEEKRKGQERQEEGRKEGDTDTSAL